MIRLTGKNNDALDLNSPTGTKEKSKCILSVPQALLASAKDYTEVHRKQPKRVKDVHVYATVVANRWLSVSPLLQTTVFRFKHLFFTSE